MTSGNDAPDRAAAEAALLELLAEGRATRRPAGGDALWTASLEPRRATHSKPRSVTPARRSVARTLGSQRV